MACAVSVAIGSEIEDKLRGAVGNLLTDIPRAGGSQHPHMIVEIAGRKLTIEHIPGPTGVRGRNSDNSLIRTELGWESTMRLQRGLTKTNAWIEAQIQSAAMAAASISEGSPLAEV